jgi:hypothetical protein
MKEDVEPGTTHNITVLLKYEKTQKEITCATVDMKLVDPKGKDQMKPLKYEDAMKSYDGYFDMKEKGKYQVMILFKAGDKKSTAGIYYSKITNPGDERVREAPHEIQNSGKSYHALIFPYRYVLRKLCSPD